MIEIVIKENTLVKLMEVHHAKQFYEFAVRGKENFIKWIPFISKCKNEEDFKVLIQLFLEKLMNGTGYLYGLWHHGKTIGIVLVREIDESANWAEIGYMIDIEHEGKGIIKEACIRLIEFLFIERRVQKIVICCDDRNERSIALAKTLGFEFEGNLRRHSRVNEELCNLMHFGLLKEEFIKD
jgi:ribosomal-protein-serine acetyltransferase